VAAIVSKIKEAFGATLNKQTLAKEMFVIGQYHIAKFAMMHRTFSPPLKMSPTVTSIQTLFSLLLLSFGLKLG
jgi:hypothetical protein